MGEYEKSFWSVNCIEEFLYYCCPECHYREHSKDFFLQHVFEIHPDAKEELSWLPGVHIKSEIPEFIECDIPVSDINLKHEIDTEQLKHIPSIEMCKENVDNSIQCPKPDCNLQAKNKSMESNYTVEKINGKYLYKCNFCEEFIRKVNNPFYFPNSTFACPKPNCKYQAKSEGFLSKHLKYHKDCPYCEKTFSGPDSCRTYNAHIKRHSKAFQQSKGLCDNCGKDLKFASKLKVHKMSCFKKLNVSSKNKHTFINKSEEIDPLRDDLTESVKVDNIENQQCKNREIPIGNDSDKINISDFIKVEVSGSDITNDSFEMKMNSVTTNREVEMNSIEESKYEHSKLLQDHKVFKNEQDNNELSRHIVHEGVKYECNLCHKTLSNRHYLKKHIQIVHEGQKNHTCETCGKEFAQKCDLKKHFKTIHEGEKVKCEICGKQFTQLTYLRTHIKFVHEGQERTKKYICEFCSKAFSNTDNLKKHVSFNHTKEPSHNCHLCGKAYANLKQHISVVHEGIKPFECDKCGKCFSSNADLTMHMKGVHEKAFRCDTCGKSYPDSNYLKHHIASVHEGEKKFKCEHCGKAFAFLEGMKCHIKTIHEGIRYQCDFCEKSFTQKPHLKSHINEVHFHEKLLL